MAARTSKKEKIGLQPKDYIQPKTKELQELPDTPGNENVLSKICVGDLKIEQNILSQQMVDKIETRF